MNNHNKDDPQTPRTPLPVYTGTDNSNTNSDALSSITTTKGPPSVPPPHSPSPPTPSPSTTTTIETTKGNTTVPSNNSNTTAGSMHMIEFHHKDCPNCDISLRHDDLITSEDYEEVMSVILSKAYDVMDVFHTDGPVFRDIKLKTLLGILKGNKDNYHLRVEFNTFPQQVPEFGVSDTATDGAPGSDSQPETKGEGRDTVQTDPIQVPD
ncbi:hypothetical protein VP1G_02969 [Cytospora mali]|uniref:Uncharacterized protein n=1 Tax=Cytospora mali TaxID=578113 RepID=A0A194UV42_CYTMA|nr:hypothetical protein VP1G_02969 [Valsa mali var. pyri (nom. inval.)]